MKFVKHIWEKNTAQSSTNYFFPKDSISYIILVAMEMKRKRLKTNLQD